MIDMSVCYTDSDNFFALTVGKIRDRTVDTELILVSKLETHIDDDHLILILESHTVEAYLLSSTEWYDTTCCLLKWLDSLLWYMKELLECLLRCEERI